MDAKNGTEKMDSNNYTCHNYEEGPSNYADPSAGSVSQKRQRGPTPHPTKKKRNKLLNPCNSDWKNNTPLGTKKLDTTKYFYIITVNKQRVKVHGTGYLKEAVVWVHKTSKLNEVLLLVLTGLRNPDQDLSPCSNK